MGSTRAANIICHVMSNSNVLMSLKQTSFIWYTELAENKLDAESMRVTRKLRNIELINWYR